MKLHALLLSSLLALAGCEKTSNVTAMQEEASGLANHYRVRLEELTKRISMLEQKGRSMVSIGQPQGLNDVRKLFLDTNKKLTELKMAVAQAPNSIANASKAPDARIEMIKLMGELKQRLEKGEIEVNANIDQVEQWLAYVEYRPKVAAAEPPPPMPQPKPEELPENPDGAMKDAPKPDGKVDAKPEGRPDAKPDAKPDTKPAAKPDAKPEPKPGAGSAR
jgi:hypothetical protein